MYLHIKNFISKVKLNSRTIQLTEIQFQLIICFISKEGINICVWIIDRREDIAFLRLRTNGKGFHVFAFSADDDPKAAECLQYLREAAVRQMEVRHETDL